MKSILLLSSLVMGSVLVQSANAQVPVHVNIGLQPAWGPVGYDYAAYYYLPEIEAYYNVPRRQFVYFDGDDWIFSSSLPGRCRNYDLYSGYKVVINERDPWYHFNEDRQRYAPYRYRHDQLIIRDGRGYGRGNYGRPYYEERGRGRNWDHDRNWRRNRDDEDRNDRGRGERDRDEQDDDHGHGNGHGGERD